MNSGEERARLNFFPPFSAINFPSDSQHWKNSRKLSFTCLKLSGYINIIMIITNFALAF